MEEPVRCRRERTMPRGPRKILLPAILAVLSCGCLDYGIGGDDAPPDPDSPVQPPDWDPEPFPREACNGMDDDGDGEVDEGFPDADGDGRADCVDGSCEIELADAEPVEETTGCTVALTPPADPWNLEVMWESGEDQVVNEMSVVVGDGDGDGCSDVYAMHYDALVAYDGCSGRTLWRLPIEDPFELTFMAMGDLDQDRTWEIVALMQAEYYQYDLAAFCAEDGTEFWRVSTTWKSPDWPAIEIADLEGDGEVEIVTSRDVFRARDGTWLRSLAMPPTRPWILLSEGLAVQDILASPGQEIISGNIIHAAGGQALQEVGTQDPSQMPLILASPEDDGPLVQALSPGDLSAWTASGGDEWSYTFENDDYGTDAACAGDIDGDGEMETVVSRRGSLLALGPDGTLEWKRLLTPDHTDGARGCTVFDFDLDGRKEILLADLEAFHILDGSTGEPLFTDEGWWTCTERDVPLVVDLDGDGSVEIVLPNGCGGPEYGYSPVRVYRNVYRDWPPGTGIWPSTTWSGTQRYTDGTVPRTPAPSWRTTRVWRGQPEAVVPGSDLRPEVTDACIASCEAGGQVRLAVRLVNLGPEELRQPVPLALYTEAEDGTRTHTGTLVSVLTLADFVDDGTAGPATALDLTLEQVTPALVLVAGDDGSGAVVTDDCNPEDNTLTWRPDACG